MLNALWIRGRFGPVIVAFAIALAAALIPAAAQAEDTVWICKPGQADDLCAGTIDGQTNPPAGQAPAPLGYTRPSDPPVDCFYLYPTQSEQAGPNSDLAKDPPIRRVVVQQARMFSTVCDVYAPMYRQVTNNGNQLGYNEQVETAYQSAKAGFEDYLQNYNEGRGFIMIGHSQGAAHTARLIDELVDKDRKLRRRFVGAIAPGANISVPIGKAVGGLFDNVPACTAVGEYGCVIAYSTYKGAPGPNAEFSRPSTGYWIYPEPRPDASRYEAMCTDPARLDGGNGVLLPLVDLDYLTTAPPAESASPWLSQPDYYRVECQRADGAHWLNISRVDESDSRVDLGAAVASGNNYHVPEVNLAEGNLLRIAGLQTDAYEADRARLEQLESKLVKAKKRKAALKGKIAKLRDEVDRAESKGQREIAKRRLEAAREQARKLRKKVRSLRSKIRELESRFD